MNSTPGKNGFCLVAPHPYTAQGVSVMYGAFTGGRHNGCT